MTALLILLAALAYLGLPSLLLICLIKGMRHLLADDAAETAKEER